MQNRFFQPDSKMKQLKEYLIEKNLEFQENGEIKSYTSMKIGGKVRFVIKIYAYFNLKVVLDHLIKNKYRFILLGGGSNVLFHDDFSDLIVIINKTSDVYILDENIFKVNSGVSNNDLMKWAIQNNIGGVEFLAGIPGTIGGAAAVNAGAFGKSISDILEKAEILTEDGKRQAVDNTYFNFSYRHSVFKTSNRVILNVYLRSSHSPGEEIKKTINTNINYRIKNHPSYNNHTAGCFFKNPLVDEQRISAGKIIEQSGLKGARFDHLSISDTHANFIINNGKASFNDITHVEKKIIQKVLSDKNIKLEREVIYISPDGKKY